MSARILDELEGVAEIKTQPFCHSKLEFSPQGSTRRNGQRGKRRRSQSWFLNIIIFGTETLGEKVGEYLSKRKMYLQDPLGCERCVPYRNPHAVSSESGETMMTDSFDLALGNLEIERLETGPDLLGQLMKDDIPLPETEAPDIVKTALFLYQKQALTFMAYSALSLPRMSPGSLDSMPPAIMKTTLLIVPPALIQAWEKQFFLHLQPGKLKCYIYHGQNKKSTEFLAQYDVVITTYHTVSAIWRKHTRQPGNEKSIFSLTWHRVILDEAHIIQNPQSQLAQACYALRSTRRWAITGTPIQNKLTDFASIVKFLRVHPYSDQRIFEKEILKPWQNRHGTDTKGFLRLKSLVRAITISRTKAVIQLPSRVDEIHHLNFSPAEREKYEAAKAQSRALFEEAISSGHQAGKTFNALCLLNILRLICNHGLLDQSTLEKITSQTPGASLGCSTLGRTPDSFYGNILGGNVSCLNCGANLLEDVLECSVSYGIDTQRRQTTPSDQMICEHCNSQTRDDKLSKSPWNNWDLLDSAESSASATPIGDSDVAFSIEFMSTKIKSLVADLYKHNITEKSVVFSYWTNTLDLVQLMLNHRGIPYTRIDGKMSLPKRNEALRAFQNDDSVRVILVSITCGGAGLDLTTGSRVYLLEPHWNPMIEEQALCRVHRQIVDIQKRKKVLAQVTFAEGPLSEAGIGLGTLQYLKSVLK
ncbi:hypothetical protein B7463_g12351, partial [Scytalidium lignicola]